MKLKSRAKLLLATFLATGLFSNINPLYAARPNQNQSRPILLATAIRPKNTSDKIWNEYIDTAKKIAEFNKKDELVISLNRDWMYVDDVTRTIPGSKGKRLINPNSALANRSIEYAVKLGELGFRWSNARLKWYKPCESTPISLESQKALDDVQEYIESICTDGSLKAKLSGNWIIVNDSSAIFDPYSSPYESGLTSKGFKWDRTNRRWFRPSKAATSETRNQIISWLESNDIEYKLRGSSGIFVPGTRTTYYLKSEFKEKGFHWNPIEKTWKLFLN